MHKELYEEFRRLEGQPVRIYTDDSRTVQGIVFCAGENATRVLLENGDVALVEFCHIDTVEEPMMRLRRNYHDDVHICLDGKCPRRSGFNDCGCGCGCDGDFDFDFDMFDNCPGRCGRREPFENGGCHHCGCDRR